VKANVALQMYTLRNECEKDFVGTLQKVAELGYQGVEFAGYYEMPAEELKSVLEDFGLAAVSSHIPFSSIEDNLKEMINYQQTIGSTKMVCPYIEPETVQKEEDFYRFIQRLNQIGQICYEEGLTLCYHNHDFELVSLSNGKTALQTLLDETNPEWVKAELDIYWLTHAGHIPVEWMKRYENRTPLIHLKDMTTDGQKDFAELGTGGVDLHSVLAQGDASNVEWWIVEQDKSRRSPLESVEMSMNHLKGLKILS